MVVHDRDRQQQWTERRLVQEQNQKKAAGRTKRWSVLGVQSLACAAILLLVFLLKLAGGGAYEELKENFHGALEENQLMAVLVDWFSEDSATPSTDESDVKQNNLTVEKAQEDQGEAGATAALSLGWPEYG